ncbi:hypothetical protein ULMS_05620 [Patiriisocius marinistellae]|uniref:Uncharacterized protein n=1 Tax=Patiriisocius marinistellae TaxID=2494560 RepID=A0A5J4FVD9_9FLAO|nr:plastocyanin/azurin family copper-binding protein [Patiriisocius marinistellae]GEQ85054.1 hypothetical protein ULMS_05620 [Patiriisocius marinistellae]
MKNIITVITIILGFTSMINAQEIKKSMNDVTIISVEQTPRAFTQKQITVNAGTYIFEVANNNVGKDVGFVLIAQGTDATNAENHIKEAYVTSVVKNNTKQTSKEVILKKGTYNYFCPLNETPLYTLTVN